MSNLRQCDFFLLRYAPEAVKQEFVNIGVVLVERGENGGGFAGMRFAKDWSRVQCMDPSADTEMLALLERELSERLAGAEREKVLQTLADSFSNSIQLSSTKALLTDSPEQELEKLAALYVNSAPWRKPQRGREQGARRRLVARMRSAFEQERVWEHLKKNIAVEPYTRKGDPLKIDCGYQPNGVIRLFHAVPLSTDVDAAKVLAFSFPRLADGLGKEHAAKVELTAVTDDGLDLSDHAIGFALETLAAGGIGVSPAAALPEIARRARIELQV